LVSERDEVRGQRLFMLTFLAVMLTIPAIAAIAVTIHDIVEHGIQNSAPNPPRWDLSGPETLDGNKSNRFSTK
jgi:hypothetical protein